VLRQQKKKAVEGGNMRVTKRFAHRLRESANSLRLARPHNQVVKRWVTLHAGILLLPLLISGLGLAQAVVTATANIPFDFWAEGRKFPAGDYVLDSGFPASISFLRKGSKASVAIAVISYGDPVAKEDGKLLFAQRDGKYYLTELWGVLGKRVVTAEFEHRGEKSKNQREVRLIYE
jgi:hypothetical protein